MEQDADLVKDGEIEAEDAVRNQSLAKGGGAVDAVEATKTLVSLGAIKEKEARATLTAVLDGSGDSDSKVGRATDDSGGVDGAGLDSGGDGALLRADEMLGVKVLV